MPQVLGRLPDGRLSFGLCAGCLRDSGGSLLQVGPIGGTRRRFRGQRVSSLLVVPLDEFDVRPPRPRAATPRRPAPGGLASLLAAWGLLLALAAASGTTAHPGAPSNPWGSRSPLVFLAAAVALGVVAMGLAVATLPPPRRWRVVLKSIQIGLSGGAFLTLLAGIVDHDPARDPAIVVVTMLCLAGAAAARWLEAGARLGPVRTATGKV